MFRKKETKSLKELGVKEVRVLDNEYVEVIKNDGVGVTVKIHPIRNFFKKIWWWFY